jgi:hypothetical protein
MVRRFLAVLLTVSLGGCSGIYKQLGYEVPDERSFELASKPGTGSVKGMVYVDWKEYRFPGESVNVYAVPDSPETDRLIRSAKTLKEINPFLYDHARITRASSTGQYEIDGLADGKWTVFSFVQWRDPNGSPTVRKVYANLNRTKVAIDGGSSRSLDVGARLPD